jgi:hypothetical protein
MFSYLYDFFSSDMSASFFAVLKIFLLIVLTSLSLIVAVAMVRRTLEPIPISHKIAVVGLPGAGKTTLITAIFELIQRGFPVQGIRLHGTNTIRAVNQNIACLNSGERIGPTKEKETFIFRFSYLRGALWSRRLFDVEIADFPGESSERISGGETPPPVDLEYTLLDREFFSWIASSREYLFLVDLSAIYSQENVRKAIAGLTARIRASWQVIEDATSERGLGTAKNRSVRIIFTKVDCLIPSFQLGYSLSELVDFGIEQLDEKQSTLNKIKERISMQGDISDLSRNGQIPTDVLDKLTKENDKFFSDIIRFFFSRVRNSEVIYGSLSLQEANGGRLGVRRVLQSILP